MADTSREAALAVVLREFLPRDYQPAGMAAPFIAALEGERLTLGFADQSVEQVREQGYQAGQKDARSHFAEMALEGLAAHQWVGNGEQDGLICTCGFKEVTSNDKKGKSPGLPFDQWRAHAAKALAGLA